MFAVSISGFLLSSEPVIQALSTTSQSITTQTLATTLEIISQHTKNIEKVTVTDYNQIIVEHRDNGKLVQTYFDITTGDPLNDVIQSTFYRRLKSFHRSLWLNDTGRWLVLFSALTLLTLCITGLNLVARRQGGWRGILMPARGNGLVKWHTILGQLCILPLLIMSVSGIYLALVTFNLLPSGQVSPLYPESELELTPVPVWQLPAFKTLPLREVKSLTFPIPDDWFDVYVLRTHSEYHFHDQFTGRKLSQQDYPPSMILKLWMLTLHSGKGAPLWAAVLGICSLCIPIFSITGFVLWLKKRHRSPASKNCEPDRAEVVILVGSETQTTWHFAAHLMSVLTGHGLQVHQADLNSMQRYPQARWLFILTSTYGNGQAPSNAQQFLNNLEKDAQQPQWRYSIVGFGDSSYPNFCGYAKQISDALQRYALAIQPLFTIDRQNPTEFNRWGQQMTAQLDSSLTWTEQNDLPNSLDFISMRISKQTFSKDGSVMRLCLLCHQPFQAGDLLAVRLKKNSRVRMYSIASSNPFGAKNQTIELCVKKIPGGVVSSWLHSLQVGDAVNARIQTNRHFHLPSNKPVAFIATGTGIAPFAGMIENNVTRQNMMLFFGTRHPEQDSCYEDDIAQWQQHGKLQHAFVAYSRTPARQYVQEPILFQADLLLSLLAEDGIIMLCGGTAMAQSVAKTLDTLFLENNCPWNTRELQHQGRFIVEAYGS